LRSVAGCSALSASWRAVSPLTRLKKSAQPDPATAHAAAQSSRIIFPNLGPHMFLFAWLPGAQVIVHPFRLRAE